MKIPGRLLVVLSFVAIYFIWGTTYLAIVIGLEGFEPFFMAAARFLIAGVLMVCFALWKGEKMPSSHSIIKNSLIGIVILCGGQGLLIWSEQYIASGYASVLVATIPIWFVIIDQKHWKLYFSNPYIIAGVILGFFGIIMLFQEKLSTTDIENLDLQILASILVLVGSMCWVAGTIYQRSRPAPGSITLNLGWQLLTSSVVCIIISLLLGEWQESPIKSGSFNAWSAVVYLAIAGSIIAFIAYTWLLKKIPSAIVGTYAYINPVVAVFLGWFIADENITSTQLLGMGVILISAILVNLNRNKIKTKV